MLSSAVTFFIIAIVAAILGLRGIAGMTAEIGYFFAVLAAVLLVVAVVTGHSVAPGP
jgi:uncharacterized membrane protein YtjA (UPF0391 family)